MAEEYGIKLRVTADTAEAKKQMDDLLERKAEKVREAAAGSGVGGGATSSSPSGASSDAGKKTGAAAAQEFNRAAAAGAKKTGRDIAKSFGDEAGGGASGRAIGKAIAGFAMHQIVGTAFAAARTPGGDNANIDRAQSAASGAMQYGTMGAMLGGPWGAAIGAALGGITGLVGQLTEERQRAGRDRQGMREQAYGSDRAVLDAIGGQAKSRLLDWQGSRDARVEWLSGNTKKVEGEYRKAIAAFNAVAGRDPESEEYKSRKAEFDRLTNAYAGARIEEYSERMKPMYDAYRSADFSDAFAKRGLGAGAQVDVTGANSEIIKNQERQEAALNKIVDIMNAWSSRQGGNVNEALNAISASF